MKARQYHKRFFKKDVKPNIVELEDYGSDEFAGIKNFGSLLVPHSSASFDDGIFGQSTREYEIQKKILSSEFHCVVTNPPYMGSKGMNKELSDFVKKRYPDSKSDLYAVFIERCLELTKKGGFTAVVTMHSWLFLSSYEKLRINILNTKRINSILHLGMEAFEGIIGKVVQTAAIIIENSPFSKGKLSAIRLVDYYDSKRWEKEKQFFNPIHRYKANQEDFSKLPESIFVYWINEKIINLFTLKNIGDFGSSKRGLQPGDVNKVIRFWNEVNLQDFAINIKDREEALSSKYKWFKFSSGGNFRKWFGNEINIVDWENNGRTIKNLHNPITPSEHLYFTKGIVWSKVSSGLPSFRLHKSGIVNGDASPCLFSEVINFNIFAFMNSKVSSNILNFISPTLNFKTADIDKLPIIPPKEDSTKEQIDKIVQQNIDISKEEWDSRETSWDFTKNELIKHKSDTKIETAYSSFCNYWREQHNTLHQNEEELNRLFIDIYELQDELTPDVELKDITILKNETKIEDCELIFQADEIIKQFISYGIGVMFGRYSLDSDGLLIANMGQEVPRDTTFEIDDDNVIPVLEDDYFKDDIASRFVQFVKATFGEEDLSGNIRFIESSLGTTLRKYFVKGFYEDHIKRYKKRPIYWMVASPKKGFMSLIYMHRYEADTFARVRNSYLTEYIAKLEAHKETLHLTTTSETASNKDKKDADKQSKNIEAKLKEVIAFDREKMMSWSQNPTDIDLDDGVKVNYCRFKDILYPITGLCK